MVPTSHLGVGSIMNEDSPGEQASKIESYGEWANMGAPSAPSTPSAPLQALTELPLLCLKLIYSAVFIPVSAWVKGDAFIDGYYGNAWKLKISPENSLCFSPCHPLPLPPARNHLTSKLGCLKKNVL